MTLSPLSPQWVEIDITTTTAISINFDVVALANLGPESAKYPIKILFGAFGTTVDCVITWGSSILVQGGVRTFTIPAGTSFWICEMLADSNNDQAYVTTPLMYS